ncbi:uncharacterized protein ACLA_008450 [Aspergillus clavatus NRRL 1]|uniref:Uncharacterized protein n=1 Tax=Aspergillus clavatus (strain ATCC 1007 / CBS 513.65 / DSM 816 / NCTC 3887 / NRRL 1 / QM 1276 / 107) TaxID=344612 RepID=A1CE08_ASPCL|nr:uncharacterized protein ACLA_008450 [Aspergillus clavatus NRRL 1]EAW12085.1 hypothetical protein ACLA_008450 [Aspergillus clavatus NRRL 1]
MAELIAAFDRSHHIRVGTLHPLPSELRWLAGTASPALASCNVRNLIQPPPPSLAYLCYRYHSSSLWTVRRHWLDEIDCLCIWRVVQGVESLLLPLSFLRLVRSFSHRYIVVSCIADSDDIIPSESRS